MTVAEWAALLTVLGFLAFLLAFAYGAVLLHERSDRRVRRAGVAPARSLGDCSNDAASVSAVSVAASS